MTEVPDEVRALAAERDERRRVKDFAAADSLRDRIEELGFAVIDGPEGPSFEPLATAEPRRIAPHDVESVLDEPPTADVSVHWVVEGWPEDVARALAGFRANEGGRDVQYVVADVTETDPATYGDGVEVLAAGDRDGLGRRAERGAQAFAGSDRPGDGRVGRTHGGRVRAARGRARRSERGCHRAVRHLDRGPARVPRQRRAGGGRDRGVPDGVPPGRDPRRRAVRREVPLVPDGGHRVLVPDQGRRACGPSGSTCR